MTPGPCQSSDISRHFAGAAPSDLSRFSNPKRNHSIDLGGCNDVHFRAALFFYGVSSVLEVCYMVFRRESEIADFAKLCLPNSCKMDKSIREICRFVNDYHDFPTGAHPALAPAGGDAIITSPKWVTLLKKRGHVVAKNGGYSLKASADALGFELPSGNRAVRAATRTQSATLTNHAPQFPSGSYEKSRFCARGITNRWVNGCFVHFYAYKCLRR